MSEPLVLGIETSCDETAVGIVRGRNLLANVISSSVDTHARFGGVVPEIASRAHLEAIHNVIDQALRDADVSITDIDAFGVTAGPGLIGALLVGTSAASGMALALNKPLYGVNHLTAHLSVDTLNNKDSFDGAIGLLVSGGHSSILKIGDYITDVETLGTTMDDAAGEAFDKIARLLKLSFPGGPAIDKISKEGNASSINFPRGLSNNDDHRFDFSFSGLKTAVSRYLQQTPSHIVADVAASFQEAVADVLVSKSIDAAKSQGISTIIIAGGVAANSRLRELAQQRCDLAKINLRIPPLALCTDNGAMVASLTSLAVRGGHKPSALGLEAKSTSDVSEVIW